MQQLQSHKFAVAPMMDWTDSHCRMLHRCLTHNAVLYTEMVTADAVLHGDRARLLGFNPFEHPLAIQLGGSDPVKLACAAKLAADFGYDEVNLNVGCPSDRVQSGSFGACLMREPLLVAECVAAIRGSVGMPVTVKCRIGVDDQDPERSLRDLIDACARAGANIFVVHARKAWLEGLSPKENRDIPPLDYGLVYRVKQERPQLTIVINGGIETLEQAEQHLCHVDGVMLGRAAYRNPMMLADVDRRFFGESPVSIDDAVATYFDYVQSQLAAGARLYPLIKPMLGLYSGRPGARLFRRYLSENAIRNNASIAVLREALNFVQQPNAA